MSNHPQTSMWSDWQTWYKTLTIVSGQASGTNAAQVLIHAAAKDYNDYVDLLGNRRINVDNYMRTNRAPVTRRFYENNS